MRSNTTLALALTRPALAAAMLAAFLLAVSSCGSGGISQPTPTVTSTPTPTVTSTPIGKIATSRQGGLVSWAQLVTGQVTGIPAGMSAWLVVQPVQSAGYWPQPGPLHLNPNGQFVAPATFGLSSTTDHGEGFILMIVEATTAASQNFKQFTSSSQSVGMKGLPDGTQILTQVTVTRS